MLPHLNLTHKLKPLQVASDLEAIALMNDSPYGLTASIWMSSTPHSHAVFNKLASEIETGTVFLNKYVQVLSHCSSSVVSSCFFFSFLFSLACLCMYGCSSIWLDNRCDSVDPSLAWTGVKDSGRGVSCSGFGTSELSVHIRRSRVPQKSGERGHGRTSPNPPFPLKVVLMCY